MKKLLVLVFISLTFSQISFADCGINVWITFECNCEGAEACDIQEDIIVTAKYHNTSTIVYIDTVLGVNLTSGMQANFGTFPASTCLDVTVESIDGCYYGSDVVCLGFCPGADPTGYIYVEQLCECEGDKIKIHTPFKYQLSQNYPNPFNPATEISYSIPVQDMVKITVYDIQGRQVTTLVNEYKDAGSYSVRFDASALSSGIYYYKLESGSYSDVKKMLLIK